MSLNEDKVYEARRYIRILTDIYGKENFVIAGGAPRDIDNGKDITDFDYYIYSNNHSFSQLKKRLYKELGVTTLTATKSEYNRTIGPNDIHVLQAVDKLCRHDLIFVRKEPVEYVNNMYGCHPDDDDNEYFKTIFAK